MKKQILILTMCLISFISYSQNFQWATKVGSTGADYSNSIDTDPITGEVISTGYYNGTVDFDPGANTFTVTNPASSNNCYFTKQDSLGNFVWAKTLNASTRSAGQSIKTDANGNIYIAGYYSGTIDLDPNAGSNMHTSNGANDIFFAKYDPSGNLLWADVVGGAGDDSPTSLTIDGSGNFYATGVFSLTVDFNPGAGVLSLTSSGANDIFIIKLNANDGSFFWAEKIGGSFIDNGRDITNDATGNIYVVGQYQGTVDFDPGATSYTATTSGYTDPYIVKLNSAGTFQWAKTFATTTATSSASMNSVEIDALNNVVIGGNLAGTYDMDPSATTVNLSSIVANSNSLFVLKLTSSGAYSWAVVAGNNSSSKVNDLCIDNANNIYLTGTFSGNLDFDPGPSSAVLAAGTNNDVYVLKLNDHGAYIFAKLLNAVSGGNEGTGITLGSYNGLYVTGFFNSTLDFDPNSSIYNLTPAGLIDAFVVKLNACPSPAGLINGTINACPNSTFNYSITPVAGATGYNWVIPFDANLTAASTSTLISMITGYNSGNIVVTPTNSCGSGLSSTLSITIFTVQTPSITAIPSAQICMGNSLSLTASGAVVYNWDNGITNGVAFSPSISGLYSVTSTDMNGCVSNASQSVTVNALPNVTASASNSIICNGSSVVLNGAGAQTYTWTNGISDGIAFTPTASNSYSVIGTDLNGCASNASQLITVNALPNVTASASNSIICNGSSVVLNGAGAQTYTWTNGVTDGIAFTPTATNSYSVIGTDLNGCQNTTTYDITINELPTISALTNNTLICTGETATISATGANTYTWSTTENGANIVVTPTTNTTYTVTGTDINGCNNFTILTQSISLCTGLSSVSNIANSLITIYPNPNHGSFTINSSEEITLSITNNLGKIVQSIHLDGLNNKQINIENLSSGIYYLVGQNNSHSVKQKIIISQ